MKVLRSPYEDDTAYHAPTQVIILTKVSMNINLSQKYRSHHITYIFLEPPQNTTFGTSPCYISDGLSIISEQPGSGNLTLA